MLMVYLIEKYFNWSVFPCLRSIFDENYIYFHGLFSLKRRFYRNRPLHGLFNEKRICAKFKTTIGSKYTSSWLMKKRRFDSNSILTRLIRMILLYFPEFLLFFFSLFYFLIINLIYIFSVFPLRGLVHIWNSIFPSLIQICYFAGPAEEIAE